MRAEVALIRFHLNLGDSRRRNFDVLAQPPRRTSLSSRAFRVPHVESLEGLSGRRAHKLTQPARVGNPFRVSGASGFRPPRMKFQKATLPPPKPRGMTWPQNIPLPKAAFAGVMPASFALRQDFPIASARLPVSRKPGRAAGLQGARSIPLRNRRVDGIVLDARSPDWKWQGVEGRQAMLHHSGLRAGQSPAGAGSVALKLVAAEAVAERRTGRALFQPQEQAWINVSYSWNSRR